MDVQFEIDKVFVKAVSTIKTMTDLSKNTDLPRPSINERLNLYGLYNQSTKGDVSLSEFNLNSSNEKKKYDYWIKYKGLSKMNARIEYIKYLLLILNSDTFSDSKLTDNNLSIVKKLRIDIRHSWDDLESTMSRHQNSQKSELQRKIAHPISDLVIPSHIPPRSHSPAASLYRMASSGINSSIIRPPSRNTSLNNKSRHNSFSGQAPAHSSTWVNTATLTAENNASSSSLGANINANSYIPQTESNPHIDQKMALLQPPLNEDFIKWQNDINSTLLKISSELFNLKLQNNNSESGPNSTAFHDPHRSISGSTSVSLQSSIQDYKLRNGYNLSRSTNNNVSRGPSYFVNTRFNEAFLKSDNGDGTGAGAGANDDNTTKGNLIKWLVTKFTRLVTIWVKDLKLFIGSTICTDVSNKIRFSIVAFILLSLFRKIADTYITRRLKTQSIKGISAVVRDWMEWIFKKHNRSSIPNHRGVKI